MPKRSDLKKILLIGSGPIVIGQACEFDYSGTQACKAIIEEGIEVVLVNSNPATIMTDPGYATRTYIEPLTPDTLAKILAHERPDAVLPTVGGQTALNLAVALAENGVLERLGIELIGANMDAIQMAEDRSKFRQAMEEINVRVPTSMCVTSIEEGEKALDLVGIPAIIRPSFTLGGAGGAIAQTREEFEAKLAWGLQQSPRNEVLIEQSIIGWKEYELEVMRDTADNVVIICSIENLDPMGIHTGDSITVAPAQTLTDKEYQRLRDVAIRIIRKIGVDTGGSNIQFAINPRDGEIVVIEMNPRVSRSSALASKATGFPIAKIAAKLALGYTLDEIPNDITRKTPSCFEPAIDYVVTKIPRFAFEKFTATDSRLGIQMKSVGEVMAIGRTFCESLQKAVRSLEIGRYGFSPLEENDDELRQLLIDGRPGRLWACAEAIRREWSIERVNELTHIDPWFLNQVKRIIDAEADFVRTGDLKTAKQLGFSDRRLAELTNTNEHAIRHQREEQGIEPSFRRIDTCAAEFEAATPYMYSTYGEECESNPSDREKVIILGGGPNRIGQGIEFDYCCVHGVLGLEADGYETIMANCNPETVSTDYDTSDRLYFEPLTLEDVLAIVKKEKPKGIIVQFGGQTPLRLATALEKEGVTILGTQPDAIDRAENRERFSALINKLGLRQPEAGTARSVDDARALAEKIGYPVLLRPSYVLGGRAMQIVHDLEQLNKYITEAVQVGEDTPVLVDRFLPDAIEVDVDALCDGTDVVVAGVMEHIEEAGVHSGDSACSLPPYSLPRFIIEEIKRATRLLALEIKVCGLMNIQFAVRNEQVYVIEVNPRASRTVPFVSKAVGKPIAQIAVRIMAGKTLKELGITDIPEPSHVSVKESVFPFVKFHGEDTLLGPEMKSTGEVMGIDREFPLAYAKAQRAAGMDLPLTGRVLISVRDSDKQQMLGPAKILSDAGFKLLSTRGTAAFFESNGLKAEIVNKHWEGENATVDLMRSNEVDLVITTTRTGDLKAVKDSAAMRRAALDRGIPYFTTVAAARVTARAIRALKERQCMPLAIQDLHPSS